MGFGISQLDWFVNLSVPEATPVAYTCEYWAAADSYTDWFGFICSPGVCNFSLFNKDFAGLDKLVDWTKLDLTCCAGCRGNKFGE